MWEMIRDFILKHKLLHSCIILLITLFFSYHAFHVKISYELGEMLPPNDSIMLTYKNFKKTFGDDGNLIFMGIECDSLYSLENYNALQGFSEKILNIEGVNNVISPSHLYLIAKNSSKKKFDLTPLFEGKAESQQQLDSIKKVINNQPIYQNRLLHPEKNSSIGIVALDKNVLNNKKRVAVIHEIRNIVDDFSIENPNIKLHCSGLPYIRTIIAEKIRTELILFTIFSMIIASIILLIFFRSFKSMLFTLTIVFISVIWTLGSMAFLEFEITILSAILPPLLVIICVENSIFLINKYHYEYRNTGDKAMSISLMITRVGKATLLTNLTTAIGFAAFIITGNAILIEFGIIASLNIISIFVISIILIPIFMSISSIPSENHTHYLESRIITTIISKIIRIITKERRIIFICTIIILGLSAIGISRLVTTGQLVDDISEKDPLYKDMMYIERQMNGILPFEIIIDTKKNNGVAQLQLLRKIDQLNDTLATYPVFSKPISVVEITKAITQAYFNGNPKFYKIPNEQEKNFIFSYLKKENQSEGYKYLLHSFADSTLQKTRISIQVANIGTHEMQEIKDDLRPKINTIFPAESYDVSLTGSTIVFLSGTNYMAHNLMKSLLLALFAIMMLMAALFSSWRMMLVSLLPTIFPQLVTAAIMGYFNIPIKPSTILIFSIALGISVDNSIHFLSRYQIHLKLSDNNIKKSVNEALKETCFGMFYSFIVLLCGFSIFIFSGFGGTKILGYLVPLTIFIAVIANCFIFPSLILWLNKRKEKGFIS